jgi:hypothetical protein
MEKKAGLYAPFSVPSAVTILLQLAPECVTAPTSTSESEAYFERPALVNITFLAGTGLVSVGSALEWFVSNRVFVSN